MKASYMLCSEFPAYVLGDLKAVIQSTKLIYNEKEQADDDWCIHV